jgi:hypothetical protein
VVDHSSHTGAHAGRVKADLMRHLRMLSGAEAMLMATQDPVIVDGLLRLVVGHARSASESAGALLNSHAPGQGGGHDVR